MNNVVALGLGLFFAPFLIAVAWLGGYAVTAGVAIYALGVGAILVGWLRGVRWNAPAGEAELLEKEGGPILYIPLDTPPECLAALFLKEREYWARVGAFPEGDRGEQHQDARCKAEILERLLRDNHVALWPVSRYMAARFGRQFQPYIFANACRVVRDYLGTGGPWYGICLK